MKALKKILKILAILLALLVVLAIAAYLLLTHFINPNDFKPKIVAMVKQETGRDFTLTGDISWTFFPNLGFHIGAASLGNPPGFNQINFAQVDSADLSLNWGALLHGQVAINQLSLNGLKVALISNKNNNNWMFPSTTATSTSSATTESSDAALSLMLDEIDINNGTITYDNLPTKSHYAVNNLNLETPNFSIVSPMEIKGSGDLSSESLSGNVQIDTLFNYDVNNNTLGLSQTALNTHLTYTMDNNQNIPLVLQVSGNINADLSKQNVDLAGISFTLNQNVTGNLDAKLNNFNALNYNGHINIGSFSLPNLLNSLGETMPNLPNKDQFTKMSLQSDIVGNLNKIAFTNLQLGFGNTLVQGSLNVNSFSPIMLNAALTANQLNLADFVDFKGAGLPVQNIAVQGSVNIKNNNFAHVNYSGNLAIQHFSLVDVIAAYLPQLPNKNIFANMSYHGNVAGTLNHVNLTNFTLGLGPSTIQGNLHVLSFSPLAIQESLTANQLDLADFVDLKGAGLPMQNISLNGGNSFNMNNFPASFNASQKLTVGDVVLKGFDLGALINQIDVIINNLLNLKKVTDAYNNIQSQLTAFETSQGPINANNGKQTDFGSLTADIEVKNGVVTTPTMIISGPLVKATGQGQVDLNAKTMNYQINAQVAANTHSLIKTLTIPYSISGSFANLQQGVNMAVITQQMVQFVVLQLGKTVTNIIKNAVTSPTTLVTNVGEDTAGAVSSVGAGVGDAAGDAVQGVAKGVAGALNSIFGGGSHSGQGQ